MAPVACRSCRGFTLVELVIGMALSLLIVGGMWLALQSQEGAYRAQEGGRESWEMLEGAVGQMQRDLQLAGAGLPLETVPALTPGSGNGKPLITIRYLMKAPFVTKLTAPGSERSKVFRIPPDDIGRFRPGDQVLIHDDVTWQFFRVEAVGSHSSPRLTLASEILPSTKDRRVWLTFPPGSEVARLRDAEVKYLLAQGEKGERHLIRRLGTQETVIATGVRDLRFEYLVAPSEEDKAASPGWTTRPPANAPILSARVHLAIGQATTHFTVTPRNLLSESAS